MSTYTAPAKAVESKALDTIVDAQVTLRELVGRMTAAMDAIAEKEGAQRCPYCGEWAMDLIDLTGEDEFGRVESEIFCKRCAPLTCAF